MLLVSQALREQLGLRESREPQVQPVRLEQKALLDSTDLLE